MLIVGRFVFRILDVGFVHLMRRAVVVGSLFSGIGGLDLGLQLAGFTIACQVENDPWCQRVLAKHWPEVKRFGDVRTVTGDDIGCVDMLAGGFPCQDVSAAGHGAGLAGTRSGLWFEFVRLIRETRPRWVLVENVAALRSRGLGTVLANLAGLGYDAEWAGLPACAFGASHVRRRMFIVAYTGGERTRNWQTRVYPSQPAEPSATAFARGNDQARSIFTTWGTRRWEVEPDVGRVADGVPTRLDACRYRGLGNAVCPPVACAIGRWILDADRRRGGAHVSVVR